MVRTVRNLQYAGTTHKFASPINFFNFIQTLPKNSTKISLIAHTRLSRFESFQKPLSNLPSTEICKLKKNHVLFSSQFSITGVFNESYMQVISNPEFLSNLENKTDQLNEWERDHGGKTVFQSLRESILENVGRPIHAFLR